MYADSECSGQGSRGSAPRARWAVAIALLLTCLFASTAGAHMLGASGTKAHRRQARRAHGHRAAANAKTKKPPRPRALLVGEFNGHKGKYKTIQEAVSAAHEGDWILIGPGDYKQSAVEFPNPRVEGDLAAGADVLVTTPNLHIRGMNRNTVMLDGTKPGTPECASEESAQNFGAAEGSSYLGNNGIVVYKASGVVLQNFSTCNFLGANAGGDSVWFDGGGSTGTQNIGSWWGEYLSSTSTYWDGREKPSDEYGIYVSNTYGPGLFTHDYANNMSDSGYYIGACPNCNSTIEDSTAEDNDLGYSGSNSGGHLVIKNSLFRNNEEGVATQSQDNDDAPSPQEGLCPKGETNSEPPAGAQRKDICWVMSGSQVVDNNNGATPTNSGAPGLVGTGMTIAGGRNDLVAGNTFANNDAWGILLLPYPGIDEKPPAKVLEEFPEDECRGGIKTVEGETSACLYEAFESEIEGNTFASNGGWKNASNGDIGEVNDPNVTAKENCWHGNVEKGGGEPSSEPAAIQTTHDDCESADAPPASGEPASSPLGEQATCDSQLVAECPNAPGSNYPRSSDVEMVPLPQEPGMADPCEGVPKSLQGDSWCRGGKPVGGRKYWG
jgi:hypothetical protein